MLTAESGLQKLKKISKMRAGHRRQLWVVSYVNQEGSSPLIEQAFSDLENSFSPQHGADGVVLINEWCSLRELEGTLNAVRSRFPYIPLGVNFLGDEKEPYGFRESFRLAREYHLQMVWTDFSGVDLIKERPPVELTEIEKHRPGSTFYCSGIHMKYSTLLNPQKTIGESAKQAMGWVDGVIVTGPATGIATNPKKVQEARNVLGRYPLGVASGVTPDNVHQLIDQIDFCLVASSLQNEKKRIVSQKVNLLRQAMGFEIWKDN